MSLIEIDSLSEPRLEPYLAIRNRHWTERSGRFIVEGLPLVQELLASDYSCSSILVDKKYLSKLPDRIDPEIDVLVLEHAQVQQVVGFRFHRGFLASGIRKPLGSIQSDTADLVHRETMAGLVGIQDPENVGGILRTCAALGIRRVLLGPGCADPFSRRVLRVSMGNSLKLQLYRSEDLLSDIAWLGSERQVTVYATCPLHDASNSMRIEDVKPAHPALILLGNEKAGLPISLIDQADCLVGIAMHSGVDSLNVCIAAGIVLHHFCRPNCQL